MKRLYYLFFLCFLNISAGAQTAANLQPCLAYASTITGAKHYLTIPFSHFSHAVPGMFEYSKETAAQLNPERQSEHHPLNPLAWIPALSTGLLHNGFSFIYLKLQLAPAYGQHLEIASILYNNHFFW